LYWISIPSFFACVFAYFCLFESPRYLILNNKFDEGVAIINDLIKSNNKDTYRNLLLSESELFLLKKWCIIEN